MLKKILLLAGVVLGLLLPAGQLLKNENPWSCSPFNQDESLFAQASQNWSEGKGYRLHQTLPFDPALTAGIPMAWGAAATQTLTGENLAHSGRLFVYVCFILLVFFIARSAYQWDGNWLAVPLALGLFTYVLSKVPLGGSSISHFQGEMPALLAGALLYRALDRKRFLIAGIFAVLVFVCKPTYVFLPLAVGVAALLISGRAAFFTALGTLVTLTGYYAWISVERKESIFSYLELFFRESSRIAGEAPPSTLVAFYQGIDPALLVLSVLFLTFGMFGIVRNRKKGPASQTTALFLFIFSCIYFLGMGKAPVDRHWGAIILFCLLGFAPYWSANTVSRFAGWIPKEMIAATVVTVILTWSLTVGVNANRQFKHTPESACASKEQSAINREFRVLVNKAEATKENTVVVRDATSHTMMIYNAGFDPAYVNKLDPKAIKQPKWVIGETKMLFPEPKGCSKYWRASTFSMLHCGL